MDPIIILSLFEDAIINSYRQNCYPKRLEGLFVATPRQKLPRLPLYHVMSYPPLF